MSKLDRFPSECSVPDECESYLMEIRHILTKSNEDVTKKESLKLYSFANAVGIIDINNL